MLCVRDVHLQFTCTCNAVCAFDRRDRLKDRIDFYSYLVICIIIILHCNIIIHIYNIYIYNYVLAFAVYLTSLLKIVHAPPKRAAYSKLIFASLFHGTCIVYTAYPDIHRWPLCFFFFKLHFKEIYCLLKIGLIRYVCFIKL